MPLLTVRMHEGGVIEGQVEDASGAPLQGVAVSTLGNDLDEGPLASWFGVPATDRPFVFPNIGNFDANALSLFA